MGAMASKKGRSRRTSSRRKVYVIGPTVDGEPNPLAGLHCHVLHRDAGQAAIGAFDTIVALDTSFEDLLARYGRHATLGKVLEWHGGGSGKSDSGWPKEYVRMSAGRPLAEVHGDELIPPLRAKSARSR
jgi:hypothetical protein